MPAFRTILGATEGAKEDYESWKKFFSSLKQRGLTGVEMIISDKCLGLVEAAAEFYPEASWQRWCRAHLASRESALSNSPPTGVIGHGRYCENHLAVSCGGTYNLDGVDVGVPRS